MDEGIIGIDDLKDFSEVISSEEAKTDVMIRMGTTDDVLEKQDAQGTNEPVDTIGYTEDEFQKEFQEDVYDPAELFDEDSRVAIQCSITERQEVTADEMADTISSSKAFNPIKKYFVVRAKFDQEDPRTIDIDIQETCLVVFSHRYKLRCYFPKPVDVNSLKSSYLKENDTMEIIIRQQ